MVAPVDMCLVELRKITRHAENDGEISGSWAIIKVLKVTLLRGFVRVSTKIYFD